MSKVFLRIGAAALSILMATGALAGCGSGENKGSSSGTAANTSKASANAAPQKVKIIHYILDRKVPSDADSEVKKYLEDKFTIEYVRNDVIPDQWKEKMTLLIASGEPWDMISSAPRSGLEPFSFTSLVQSKMAMPLDDLLKKHGQNLMKEVDKVDKNAWNMSKGPDGKIYTIPTLGFKAKVFLHARLDWMKKLNIENPKTIEDFEKMMIAFRDKDPDGNGKNDTYPMTGFINSTGSIPFSWLDSGFVTSFVPTGAADYEDKDGNLVPPFMHPGYKQYLATLQKWYKEKLLHPEYLLIKEQQVLELIAKDVSGVLPAWYGRGGNELTKAKGISALDVPDIWYSIPWPVGPSGKSGALSDNVYRQCNFINAKTKPEIAERIVQVMDWFQTPEGAMFNYFGIEGKHWSLNKEKNIVVRKMDAAGKSAAYRGQLVVSIGNEWVQPEGILESNTTGKLELSNSLRAKGLKGEIPTLDPVTYQMNFNFKDTGVEGIVSDLKGKLPLEMYVKIVSGEKPVEYLDEFIKIWKSKGGDKLIEEQTKQYKQQKAQFK